MKTYVAVLLLGVVAISVAEYGNVRLRQNPVKSYGQPMVHEEEVREEEPAPAVYKPAVKTVPQAPIRVMQEPVVSNYGSSGYNRRDEDRITDEQNKNAKYAFGSSIDDGIMDHSHVRQESRDGLNVEGSYAYSDGFVKRIVNYVADENGYRIVSESTEPISESGPKIDLVNGKADVHTQIGGVDNQYSVNAQDIPLIRGKKE